MKELAMRRAGQKLFQVRDNPKILSSGVHGSVGLEQMSEGKDLGNEVRKVAGSEIMKHGKHLTQGLTHAP